MKASELKKLIHEEVRKIIKGNSAPIPTAKIRFMPYKDIDGLAEFIGDVGMLNNALFVFDPSTPGVVVLNSDVNELKQAIAKYESY